MKMNVALALIIVILSCNQKLYEAHRIRVLNKVRDHLDSEVHDAKVDHELFLGKDSQTFESLPENQSKEKLRKLVENYIDKDQDGFVTSNELRDWIVHVAEESKNKDLLNTFSMYVNGTEDTIDYEVYFQRTYGDHKEEEFDLTSRANLKLMKMQDHRKWKVADENNDGRLSLKEFEIFLHPEEHLKMKSLLIDEALEISDKDGDGALNVDEYIKDLWPGNDEDVPSQEVINREKESFHKHRDFNNDGILDRYEIGEWLMPTDYDPVKAEVQHLVAEADSNKDGKLSIEEIMDSHELFAGSQITEYGNNIKHQEL